MENKFESTGIKVFNPENIHTLSLETINTFSEVFQSAGYIRHEPEMSLISEKDHSVRFIGSTTNVFKEYLKDNSLIPKQGYSLVQKCLRTRNTNTLFDDSVIPEWSSYFTAMGAIAPSEDLGRLFNTTIEFLEKLKINREKVRINISSTDNDLLIYINNLTNGKFNINIDGVEDLNYYRHKYGLENVIGHNFNIAIKNEKINEYRDIGNIVLIKKNQSPIAVEMGIGVSNLISKKFNLNNSVESSSISKIIPYKPDLTSKFSDTLSTCVVMVREKITPGSRDKARLLRTNLVAITYFKYKFKLTIDEIKNYVDMYEKEEFGEITNIGNKIVEYLLDNEKKLPNTTYDFNWGKNNKGEE